jgi:hypothetical protein
LLLVLVAIATLTVVYPPGAQDTSRMCVTRSIVHGSLHADSCLGTSEDSATFGGHVFTDKAPGVSFLAVPAAVAVGLGRPGSWHPHGDLRLWFVRLSTGGLALLVSAFLIGRIGEGLAPGWGGASLVTYATGTLAGGLAADNFGEVPAATFAFAAFVLAWRRSPGWAGLVAGLGLLVEYQTAVIAAVVCGYVALGGARAFGRYLAGLVPGVLLLGLYDRVAFGSPFHLSYRYVSPQFQAEQSSGVFGVHSPSLHALVAVLVGHRGALVVAPVLAASVAGLVLLWRRGVRAEALLCAAVALIFIVVDAGYFDPWGGDSDGARFLIPSLPFQAVGLAPAFARWRVATSVLAAISVVGSTAVLLTWPGAVNAALTIRGMTIWQDLAQLPAHGAAAPVATFLQKNVLSWFSVGLLGSAAVVLGAALGAFALTVRDGFSAEAAPALVAQQDSLR